MEFLRRAVYDLTGTLLALKVYFLKISRQLRLKYGRWSRGRKARASFGM